MKEQPVSNINLAKNDILSGKETEVLLTKNGKEVVALVNADTYFEMKQLIEDLEIKCGQVEDFYFYYGEGF